jgi:autotransporter-associated beta strand protein
VVNWSRSATLVACLSVLVAEPAGAQSWNYYPTSTSSFFVPFAGGPMNGSLYGYGFVSLTTSFGAVLTNTSNFAMDTGSTGILASSDRYMPGPSDTYVGPGSITYTSSGNINQGLVYMTDVVINGQGGQTATARVPILLVTSIVCEPGKQASGQCTPNPNPTNVAFMGVGFDRGAANAAAGAATQLSPSGNPFLSLTAINGAAVPATMRSGFIISNATTDSRVPGVTLGLTSGGTDNFAFVQLTPNGAAATCSQPISSCGLAGNFNPTTMTVTANGASATGQVLQDTGINYMFLTPPAGSGLTAGAQAYAPNGTPIQIALPGQTGTAASYTFVVGEQGVPPNLLMPAEVQVVPGSTYVNTGRQFFFGFDYLYDPYGGFVGYRWNREIDSQYGSVTPMLALQGTLALDNGFASSFPTYLMDATILQQTGTGTISGNISGPGSLALAGGTMNLSGVNTYTGGTIVNGGILNVNSATALPMGGALAINGGQLNLNGNSPTIGNLSGTGGVLALGGGRLSIDTSGASTLATTVTGGGGLSLFGNGQLSLTGANTYTGETRIFGGLLAVNGSITSDVTVGSGGTLGGTGTIFGNVTNGGLVAPGNSIGTLNIAGNYSQSGGTYQAEVNASRQGDRLNATGTATIGAGSTMFVLPQAGSYAPRTTYTLLNAAGGVTGAYASVTSALPFLQPSLSYDANNVYLSLQIGGFARGALTPNQAAVGAVLDATALNAAGDYATVIGALSTLSAQQGQAVMNAISGQNYSGFSSSMAQGIQLFLSNFAGQAGGGGSLTGSSRVALAEACDVACDSTVPALWSAWGGMLGGLGTMSGSGSNAGTLTYSAGGFAGGLDRLVAAGLRVGVTAGYQNANQWVGGFSGQGNSNSFQAGLYANFVQDKVYADAIAGYAYSANQMWRSIAIPGLAPRTAIGNTGANQFYGQVETGYRFDLGGLADAYVTPFARLQAYTGTQNAFTETGAGSLNLSVAQQTTNSLRSVLGAQLGGAMDVGWRDRLALKMRFGWSHEYADTARPVTASFAGAPVAPFTTYGVAPQRDGVVLGLAANTAVADATSIYLRYEGEVSGQDNAHAFTAGFRMTW